MIRFIPAFTKKATASAVAAVTLLAGAASIAATPASASGPSLNGCPYGAVCIKNASNSPVFYSYGSHKLYNQFGVRPVVNNQYGGAGYQLCTGSYGNGTCTKPIFSRTTMYYNLTPYNSIVLLKAIPCLPQCPI